jgi:hypothetical protein
MFLEECMGLYKGFVGIGAFDHSNTSTLRVVSGKDNAAVDCWSTRGSWLLRRRKGNKSFKPIVQYSGKGSGEVKSEGKRENYAQ